ncbi:MAG: phosphoribosyltransferase family protein [Phycisphaerales bacterium]|nr:phosphoribosyltransferase family protein [Phycisphaerales bacterium]
MAAYTGGCVDLVRALKYEGWWELARPLGQRLGRAIRSNCTPGQARAAAVVAMPSTWARRWRRGFNPASLIAEAAAAEMGATRLDLLWRTHGAAQAGQARSARLRATSRGWHLYPMARRALRGRHVVLIDDVLTTGRTAGIAARLLRRAGAASIEVGVIAVTENQNADIGLNIPG